MSDIVGMLDELISSSIFKSSQSGIMVHDYRVPLSELGRQRLTDQLVGEFRRVCERYDIVCEYDEEMSAFRVHIDLRRCVMTPSQARAMDTAMSHYQLNE